MPACERAPLLCEGVAGLLGNGKNANRPNGSLTRDRFDALPLPRLIQQSPVRQAVSGHGFSIVLELDNTTTFMGLINDGKYSLESVASVRRIHAGEEFVYFELLNGSWLAAGKNDEGQLGLGFQSDTAVRLPQIVPGLEGLKVRQVALGEEHGIFVLANGSALGIGANGDGQLGMSGIKSTSTPVRLSVGGVKAAAAGEGFTLLVLHDGRVLGAGDNDDGQLGLGPGVGTEGVPVFTEVPCLPRNVVAAAASDDFSLFLTSNGLVFGTGENKYGQLGLGDNVSRNLPVQLPISNIKQIEAGEDFSVFVTCNGTAFTVGNNNRGQLGIGSFEVMLLPVQVPHLENVRCADVGPDSSHVFFLIEGGMQFGVPPAQDDDNNDD